MKTETTPVLSFKGVTKTYPGNPPVVGLDQVSFAIEPGAFTAIYGPSGSGKTTLLNLASGLDLPTSGEIKISDQSIQTMTQRELSRLRRERIGFVFQSYNLFPVLTACENVEYTSLIRGDSPAEAKRRALDALGWVGLSDKAHVRSTQLSGGQQQRVAVARAIASQPDLVFADEPTANLDTENANQLIDLFVELNHKLKMTFVFSTHDSRLLERVRLKIGLRDGRIIQS